jgi:hypothetical protein
MGVDEYCFFKPPRKIPSTKLPPSAVLLWRTGQHPEKLQTSSSKRKTKSLVTVFGGWCLEFLWSLEFLKNNNCSFMRGILTTDEHGWTRIFKKSTKHQAPTSREAPNFKLQA